MRFTTAKKTRNPNADIICWSIDCIAVVIEKRDKMSFQFSSNHILPHFLLNDICRILIDLYNPLDCPVNILCKHIADDHGLSLPYDIKRSIVIIRLQSIKQSHLVAIKFSGIHDQNRHIGKIRLHGFQ